MEQSDGAGSTIRFGVFEVDPRSGELRKAGTRIRLQEQPFKVLLALLEHSGKVVSRDTLRRRIWPTESFGDFDHAVNVAFAKLRTALGDSADTPRYVETLHRRGYRFVFPVAPSRGQGVASPVESNLKSRSEQRSERETIAVAGHAGSSDNRRARIWGFLTVSAILAVATGTFWYYRPAPKLSDRDTIVLADFTNTTGDPVFDGTLRQGLTVQLEQSPFLNIVSEQRIQQTLLLMGQLPDARLTPEIAGELCKRTQSTAVLTGSIATLGRRYVLGLKAMNCRNGESLAEEQEQATSKEQVLTAMDKAAVKVRRRLGESLGTVQKFDTPVEQATTPSLEALQAYSLGRMTLMGKSDFAGAVPFFQRAISLDPNFAMAYSALGNAYWFLGETSLGAENVKKAYNLRERVSDREKFYIECNQEWATGDLEKARRAYELWAETYPRDFTPRRNLASIYESLGQDDNNLVESREALRLDPESAQSYDRLAEAYLSLSRLKEARATVEEAQAKKLDSPVLRLFLYQLDFLDNDEAGMAQQVTWAAGKSAVEDLLLDSEADTAAYAGRIKKAREFSRLAVSSAARAKETERAASYEAAAALREALVGEAADLGR